MSPAPADIDPRAACPEPAGSEAKILFLEARAARHLPLFNPDDCEGVLFDPDPEPVTVHRARLPVPTARRD
jgi:hypothetical protein